METTTNPSKTQIISVPTIDVLISAFRLHKSMYLYNIIIFNFLNVRNKQRKLKKIKFKQEIIVPNTTFWIHNRRLLWFVLNDN